MGNSGGFRIVAIEEIKINWTEIRKDLINSCGNAFSKAPDYWQENAMQLYDNSKKLPKKIDNFSNNAIIKMLHLFESYDCPCMIGELIYTAEGSFVSDEMNILSTSIAMCAKTTFIKTWS